MFEYLEYQQSSIPNTNRKMDNPSIKKTKNSKMSKSCKALLTLLGKDEKKAEIELGKCDVKSLKPEDQQKVLDFHKKLYCSRFTIDTDTDKQSYCKVSIKSSLPPNPSITPASSKSITSSLSKKLESLPLTLPEFSDVGASSGPNRPAPKLAALPQTFQESSDTGASSGPSRPAPKLTALPQTFQQSSNVGASSGGRNVVGNLPGRHTEGS